MTTKMDEIRRLIDTFGFTCSATAAAAATGERAAVESVESSRSSLLQAVEGLEVEAAKSDSWRQASKAYKRERDEALSSLSALRDRVEALALEWEERPDRLTVCGKSAEALRAALTGGKET